MLQNKIDNYNCNLISHLIDISMVDTLILSLEHKRFRGSQMHGKGIRDTPFLSKFFQCFCTWRSRFKLIIAMRAVTKNIIHFIPDVKQKLFCEESESRSPDFLVTVYHFLVALYFTCTILRKRKIDNLRLCHHQVHL